MNNTCHCPPEIDYKLVIESDTDKPPMTSQESITYPRR